MTFARSIWCRAYWVVGSAEIILIRGYNDLLWPSAGSYLFDKLFILQSLMLSARRKGQVLLWVFPVSPSVRQVLVFSRGDCSAKPGINEIHRFVGHGGSICRGFITPGLSDLRQNIKESGDLHSTLWGSSHTVFLWEGKHHFMVCLGCLVFVMGIISTHLMRQLC